jgi:hypothetical protein
MRIPWLLGLIALTGCDDDSDTAVPVITLTSPAAADWSSGSVVVSGVVTDDTAVEELTINGEEVTPDADGSFTHTIAASPGVLSVVVRAQDAANNHADVRASVLVGQRLPGGEPLPDALRLQLGPDAIDGIADMLDPGRVEEPVDATLAVLDSACGPMTVSAEWLSAEVGGVGLMPTDAGLELLMDLSDLKIALTAEGCGIVSQGALVVPAVSIHSVTALSVDGDGPQARTVSAWSELSGMQLYMGQLSDTLVSLGLSEERIGAALAVAVAGQVSGSLTDLLSEMRIKEQIVLVDHRIELDAPLSGVSVSAEGVVLRVDADIEVGIADPHGSLLLPQPDTLAAPEGDLSLSLPLNTLNRLLHSLWLGDGLDLNNADLNNILLAALFPEASDVRITLTPELPPVISPAEDSDAMFGMDLPGVAMTITGKVGKRRVTLAAGHLALAGGLDVVGAPGAGLTLQAGIDTVSLDLSEGGEDATLETLLSLLTGQSMELGTLPAPQITELPVGISGAGPDGDHHWLTLEASLR